MFKNLIYAISVLPILVSCGGTALPDNIIELPLTWHEGYGPVTGTGSGYISFQSHPFENCLREQAGELPDDMSDVQIGVIVLNHYQVMYQAHAAGKVPQDMYDFYSTAWDSYDESVLSPKPIRSYILVAVGSDADGKPVVVVDANANNDFTDDGRLTLSDPYSDPECYYPVSTQYDKYADGKVQRVKRPMIIFPSIHQDGEYLFNFYDYATIEKDGRVIGVVGNSLREQDRDFSVGQIENEDLATSVKNMLSPGEYFAIDGVYYKILDLTADRGGLLLERMPEGKLYSTQVGMEPLPFSGRDITTGDEISLGDHRGKYVYIDIWSQGCGPCVAEMPMLSRIYEGTDRSRIVFIGIADGDEASVRQIMERQGVNWPTILNTADNDIIKSYNINVFPSPFLIGPDGTVLSNTHSCYLLGDLYKFGALTPEEYKTLGKQMYGMDIYLEEDEPEA